MTQLETFKLIIARYYKNNILKLLLTCLGISLGLALFITTRSYSDTILSYVSEQTQLKSFTELTVKSKNGIISYETYQRLCLNPYIDQLIGKVSSVQKVKNQLTNEWESLTVIGLDMINIPSESNDIIDQSDIEQLFNVPYAGVINNGQALSVNNSIQLMIDNKIKPFSVVSNSTIQYTQENFLFIDLVTFFELFPKKNYLSGVDIVINPVEKPEFLESLALISEALYIVDPSENANDVKRISDSFSVNLIFLSTFAILVSLFISYQYFNFTASSRQTLYQKLLALGMKQRTLFLMIMLEIGLIFLVSFLLSLFFGSFLAKMSLSAVKQTISLLYFPINPDDIVISPSTIYIAFLIGLVSYLFNIIEPLLNIRFQQSFFRQGYETINKQSFKKVGIACFVGTTLMVISLYFILSFIQWTGSVYGGYVNMFLYLLGVILLIPMLIFCASLILKKIKNPFFSAALSSIEKFPFKNIVTISSLALAFSLFLSLSFFIGSFRSTVIDWIEHSNWADIYIYNEANQVDFEVTINDDLLQKYIQHEDVEYYDFLTHYEIIYQALPTSVIASHFNILEKYPKRLKLQHNIPLNNPSKEVYISESFKQKFNVDMGDIIHITGELGSKDVIIKDIFYSYGTDRGIIQMSRELAAELFHPNGVHGLGLKLNKSIKQSSFMETFQEQSNEKNILLSSNEGLRDRALEVFDQTFKITWMLAVIAGVIAGLSLINYVSITLIDRKKELVQLRSIGASHRFLRRFILSQVFIITLKGLVVSFCITIGVLYLLIETINKPVFGWTIQMQFSYQPLLISIGLALGLSYITVWVAMKFKKKNYDELRIGHDL